MTVATIPQSPTRWTPLIPCLKSWATTHCTCRHRARRFRTNAVSLRVLGWERTGPSADDDVREVAARAGGALAVAIASPETEGRLPAAAGQFGDVLHIVAAAAGLPFPVDPLDRLVDGLQGDAVQRRIEMQPLPAAAGEDRLGGS